MQWDILPDGLGAVGRGRRDFYLVTGDAGPDGREVTSVRLTRWHGADGLFPALVADEASRNVIVFPLGRGPGRPAMEPEVAGLMSTARGYAERFEAGEDLEGYPAWRHERRHAA
jgi:hypothetical protein